MNTLAIDQGTTSTRGLIVDDKGRVRTLAAIEHRQIYPAANHVEHDPNELLRNVRACLAAASGIGDLSAIGIDNQGESCLGWHAETGEAVTPVIVWQDSRTAALTEELKADGVEPFVIERAGLPLDPYFSASKLGWIVREVPLARRLASQGKLRLGTTDAFFLQHLTGRCLTDVTTASRTSLMNLAVADWDPELCRLFGVPIDALPPIVPTTGTFGGLDCGGRSVPLTASVVDQQASLFGHGCRSPGDAKITFGTGAFALAVTGKLLRGKGGGPLPTVAWQLAGQQPTYALDGGVYCASAAVNWARGLGLFRDYSEIDGFARAPAIARGLAFVPALTGLACPHWNRSARGTWLGLSLDSDRQDLMQALLEGVAMRTAEVIAAMADLIELKKPISIDGGMVSNGYFCNFLADTLQSDLIISAEPELTAVGTAGLAATAAGQPFSCPGQGRRIAPRPVTDQRRELFAAAIKSVAAFPPRVGA